MYKVKFDDELGKEIPICCIDCKKKTYCSFTLVICNSGCEFFVLDKLDKSDEDE